MITFLIAFALISGIALHEMGHAIAMKQVGMRIERICLLGFPGIFTLRLPIRLKSFPETEWVLHPLIIGAYVKPFEGEEEKVKYPFNQYMIGMGPLVNLMIASLCMGCFYIALLMRSLISGAGEVVSMGWMALAFFVLTALMWRARYFLCRYVLLPLGFAAFSVFCYLLITVPLDQIFAGPVTIGSVVHDLGTRNLGGTFTSLAYVFFLAMAINVSLGVFNLMPFLPLDGGHLARNVMKGSVSEYWLLWYERLGVACFVFMLAAALWSDLKIISSWLV